MAINKQLQEISNADDWRYTSRSWMKEKWVPFRGIDNVTESECVSYIDGPTVTGTTLKTSNEIKVIQNERKPWEHPFLLKDFYELKQILVLWL